MIKEKCGHCTNNINIGHAILECSNCNVAIHTKCHRNAKFLHVSNQWVCNDCQISMDLRYNPFTTWLENENDLQNDSESYDPSVLEISNILNNCRSYTINDLNKTISCNKTNELLSTLFFNIDGNATNFDQFSVELKTINHKFCAIGLAETNTDPNVSKTYQLPGYKGYYQNVRENKQSGTGVSLYIHESLNVSVVEEISECSTNIECLFLKTTNTTQPLILGVVYRPNDGNKDEFYEHLNSIFEQLPKSGVFVMGDFNINLLSKTACNKFEDCFLSGGFAPLISTFTHERPGTKKSCIDNILANSTDKVTLSGTISDNLTHHLPIFQFSNFKVKINDAIEKHVQYYDFSNQNVNNFVQNLAKDLEDIPVTDNFEIFTDTFMTNLDKNCKLKVPRTTKRTPLNNPWITEGIIQACHRKHELKAEWKKTISKDKPNGDQTLHQLFSTYRRTLKHIINTAKSSYRSKQIADNKEDKRKTWKIINELRGKSKQQMKPSFVIDNKRIIDRRIIANKFNEYFNSIAARLNESIAEIDISDTKFKSFQDYMSPQLNNSLALFNCTADEIMEIISDLDNNKSSDIPVRVVKKASHIISPVLSEHFNNFMNDGVFPDVLKVGKVTPVYKKDDPEAIENYRPISTLPVFGKIFEKIIYTRLYSFLQSQNILHKNQYGFRKSHSTSHAINYSVTHINNYIKQRHHVLGIFIDLSKAFDTIDHSKLLFKLDKYGIRGMAHQLLKSYLSNRLQYTNTLGENSKKLTITYGVPQGSVLGPLLFLIYVNDITNCSNYADFILFADDTNIFVEGPTPKEAYHKANIVLKSVSTYMMHNKLHINMSKCCYIHFEPPSGTKTDKTKPEEAASLTLKLNNIPLKKVTSTKFLGVIIDNKLSWGPHIKDLKRKLNYSISTLSRIKNCIPEDLHKDLYYTLFESHLTYCITVWGNVPQYQINELLVVQKKCIRILFGDFEAYKDKFKTCARARSLPKANQILGPEFYKKEHTKPLFKKHGILAIQNLYSYHCFMEVFKILKFRTPISLHSLYTISKRKEINLIPPLPNQQFLYKSSCIWNTMKNKLDISDFSCNVSSVKTYLKRLIHHNQHRHNEIDWTPSHDFDLLKVTNQSI